MALTRPKYSSIEDTDYKASCRIVTTTNITLTGGAPDTYDTISLAAGDRVLVTGQSLPAQNGIYVIQTLGTGSNGTWIRSKDANADAKVTAGLNTYIEEGTYAAQQWRLTNGNPISLGVTELTFIAPSGGTVGGSNTNIQYNASGAMAGATNFRYWAANGNVTIGSTTTSTNANTGALVVKGGAAIAGNVYADALRTTTGIYWSGNGNPIAGITYTASSSAPSGPSKGDQWYNTSNDVLYEYVFDGTSSYWVDIQTSIIAANASTALTDGIQANIGAFYTYANTKIGTNTNGNLVVDATTTSTTTTTGALVVKGGAGIAGNINIGSNASIAANLTVTQSGLFRGPYDENSTLSGVFVGNTGTGVGITPRVGFFNGNTQQNWQIDNNIGELRFFVPGSSKMTLYSTGNLNVSGGYTVGGKKAVNGPAFRAFIAVGQTIVGNGTQQRVTFGSETFDTDNCFTSSTFTPTVEGYYQLNATVRIAGTAGTGENMLVIYKNGGEYARGTNGSGTEIGSNFYSMQVSDIAYANGTTDNFDIRIQQGSGGNRDTTAGTNISYFSGCMIRGA
jgi:hypothetical protein